MLVLVTPYVGVWIETNSPRRSLIWLCVTPYVGVWIETNRERDSKKSKVVTPYVGVWIETWKNRSYSWDELSHTLRGCVD